jgi:hypothetical protein
MSDIAEVRAALRERAARYRSQHGNMLYYGEGDARLDETLADALASIEAATLERAAKVAEDHYYAPQAFTLISREIAAAIRALKEQP